MCWTLLLKRLPYFPIFALVYLKIHCAGLIPTTKGFYLLHSRTPQPKNLSQIQVNV